VGGQPSPDPRRRGGAPRRHLRPVQEGESTLGRMADVGLFAVVTGIRLRWFYAITAGTVAVVFGGLLDTTRDAATILWGVGTGVGIAVLALQASVLAIAASGLLVRPRVQLGLAAAATGAALVTVGAIFTVVITAPHAALPGESGFWRTGALWSLYAAMAQMVALACATSDEWRRVWEERGEPGSPLRGIGRRLT